ncbi:MAG TPA: hypothetical protein EYN53_11705, partial [Dehalococcoidia bacterium]|nr:hypothetical protein [Dehalococcoidia bacterium]
MSFCHWLNIGPKADGTIPEIMVDRLQDIGEWLGKNGSAIYGTTVNRITQSGKVSIVLVYVKFKPDCRGHTKTRGICPQIFDKSKETKKFTKKF